VGGCANACKDARPVGYPHAARQRDDGVYGISTPPHPRSNYSVLIKVELYAVETPVHVFANAHAHAHTSTPTRARAQAHTHARGCTHAHTHIHIRTTHRHSFKVWSICRPPPHARALALWLARSHLDALFQSLVDLAATFTRSRSGSLAHT
jgi:hypothetical protein